MICSRYCSILRGGPAWHLLQGELHHWTDSVLLWEWQRHLHWHPWLWKLLQVRVLSLLVVKGAGYCLGYVAWQAGRQAVAAHMLFCVPRPLRKHLKQTQEMTQKICWPTVAHSAGQVCCRVQAWSAVHTGVVHTPMFGQVANWTDKVCNSFSCTVLFWMLMHRTQTGDPRINERLVLLAVEVRGNSLWPDSDTFRPYKLSK